MDAEERKIYNRDYQKTNRKALNDKSTSYGRKLWLKCIEGYGGRCSCCGEQEIRFLTIDHINDERPEFPDLKPAKGKNRASTKTLYRWLIKKSYPEGFRVLCWNCNSATRWGRDCPHHKN